MIVTSGAYDEDFDYDKRNNKKNDKIDYNDKDSLQMLGIMVRESVSIVPKELLNKEYNFIYLDKGKAVQKGLGKNWKEVWKQFLEFKKKNLSGVLLKPNGHAYTYSGPRNNWYIYYEAMEAIGLFFKQNSQHLKPALARKDNGIYYEADFKRD